MHLALFPAGAGWVPRKTEPLGMCSEPQKEADGWLAFPESGHLQLQGKLRQGWNPSSGFRGGASRKLSLSWNTQPLLSQGSKRRRGGTEPPLSQMGKPRRRGIHTPVPWVTQNILFRPHWGNTQGTFCVPVEYLPRKGSDVSSFSSSTGYLSQTG